MDISNELHGIGVGLLAISASVTLISLFGAFATPEENPPHSAKAIGVALFAAIIAVFLIGATS